MSSSAKTLAILGLFNRVTPTISAADISRALGYSHATAYRYIRDLCETGFLDQMGSRYFPGPAILELDYLIRQADPLGRVLAPAERLMATFQCEILITGLFADSRPVIIHRDHSGDRISTDFERGYVLPLFKGASSKMLISGLSPAKQKRLFESRPAEAAAAGLPGDWPGFQAVLSQHRSARCVESSDELAPGIVDIAVPLAVPPTAPLASLALLFSSRRYQHLDRVSVRRLLIEAVDQMRE